MNKALLLWSFKHNLYFFKSIMVKAQTFKWPVLFSLMDSSPLGLCHTHFFFFFVWLFFHLGLSMSQLCTSEISYMWNKQINVGWLICSKRAVRLPCAFPSFFCVRISFSCVNSKCTFFFPCDWSAQNIIDSGVCHGFPPHLVPHCVLLKAAQSVAAGACR